MNKVPQKLNFKIIQAIIAVLLTVCLTACSGVKEKDDENSKPSRGNNSSTANQSSTDSAVSETDFPGQSDIDYKPDGSIGKESSSSAESAATNDDFGIQKGTEEKFSAVISDYHPGVPGYGNRYHVTATYEGVQTFDFTLSSSTPGVTCSGNEIFISAKTKEQYKEIVVIAAYAKNNKYTETFKIHPKQWKMTLSDDFDTYNTKLWKGFEINSVRQDNPYAVVKDTGVYVKNGILHLEPKIETTSLNGNTYNYSSAAISTRGNFSQDYGCFTAKIKTADKGGILNGFWILPEGTYGSARLFTKTDEYQRSCGEIDIMENHAADRNGAPAGSFGAATCHYWNSETAEYAGGKGISFSDAYKRIGKNPVFDVNRFYEYSCVWTRYAVYYYIDGELSGKVDCIKSDGTPDSYIILSAYAAPSRELKNETVNGIRGIYSGWFGFLKDEDYGSAMQIDYLRVYK